MLEVYQGLALIACIYFFIFKAVFVAEYQIWLDLS